MEEIENKRADEKRTSMPSSKWNQTIAAAIKNHCPLEGMNKEQVKSAIGTPDEDSDGSFWKYYKTVRNECVRYDGDNCAEYREEKHTESFAFSPNGYLTDYQEPSDIANNWIRAKCFKEPFYSRYYKSW